MIVGPARTPYEDGLFFFDFQLSSDYPQSPPVGHYYSYCTDRLNPNLYEDGKVCVSLLGTWSGKGTESWTPNSNMLQLLVSIQGKRRDVCDVGRDGREGEEGHGRTRKVLLGRFRRRDKAAIYFLPSDTQCSCLSPITSSRLRPFAVG